MMRSQNEIRSTCVKAARGAGHSSGLADDLAAAALWLCQNHFDGIGVLLAELRMEAKQANYQHIGGILQLDGASAGCVAVCAVDGLLSGMVQQAELKSVSNPLMVLGVLGTASHDHNCAIKVDGWAEVNCGQVVSVGDTPPADECVVRLAETRASQKATAAVSQIDIEDHRWSVLEAFAARTYVPATAQSRAAGAGAGLTDND